MPGIVPGQMALGHSSALAGAPSITGGILIIDSSSLGNLKPASLKAFPKSLSLGKSMWHVLQLVPYMRENAGIAKLSRTERIEKRNARKSKDPFIVRNRRPLMPPSLWTAKQESCDVPLPTCDLLNGLKVFRLNEPLGSDAHHST